MPFHISIEDAQRRLAEEASKPYAVLFKKGSMSVEYFAPKGTDTQTPHEQDEIYVIVSGNAEFIRENEKVQCKSGDVLFVPAGMSHRFEKFSNDFATWVIFYGPKGGEE